MAMQILRASLSFIFLCLVTIPTNAQTDNLLRNPQADVEAQHWRTSGQVAIEEVNGNRCFVVRNGGSFSQDVTLPREVAGQYVVFIGRGSSERVNPDGSVTDLPYLYGYMLAGDEGRKERVLDYLQGRAMLGRSTFANEWVEMSGIFRVPEGATQIRFFLNQGLGRGVERDGSAARFDDVGLYIFPTEEEAKAFVRR
jgi:hypothetical protein